MKDTRAAIAEALEARVKAAEESRDQIRYAVAYAAHAAFTMGEDPTRAARSFTTEEISHLPGADPRQADLIGRATAEVVAIAQAVWAATR